MLIFLTLIKTLTIFSPRHGVFSPDLKRDVGGSAYTAGMIKLVETRTFNQKSLKKKTMTGKHNVLGDLPSLCPSFRLNCITGYQFVWTSLRNPKPSVIPVLDNKIEKKNYLLFCSLWMDQLLIKQVSNIYIYRKYYNRQTTLVSARKTLNTIKKAK